MKQRIITALILAPLVIAGIFLLPIPGFLIALTAVTVIGFWEWTQFVNAKSRLVALVPALAVVAGTLVWLPFDVNSLSEVGGSHQSVLMAGGVWWLIASALVISYPNSSKWWSGNNVIRHVFGLLTMVPFLWSVVLLRAAEYQADPYYGAKLVLLVCFLVWAADSGAYFAGKSFGKYKMAPAVSPNKTIEGLIGGIVAAMLVAWGASSVFGIHFSSFGAMLGISMVTVIISVLGDLAESMFKRVSGIKDSGNILPGHGGILDRIDSLTAAFPVFALLYFW